VPFLAFPTEFRRVIYTTDLIESINARLHKVTPQPRPIPFRTSRPSIHDLLRRANPHPMKPATVTYTDGRTLPWQVVAVLDPRTR